MPPNLVAIRYFWGSDALQLRSYPIFLGSDIPHSEDLTDVVGLRWPSTEEISDMFGSDAPHLRKLSDIRYILAPMPSNEKAIRYFGPDAPQMRKPSDIFSPTPLNSEERYPISDIFVSGAPKNRGAISDTFTPDVYLYTWYIIIEVSRNISISRDCACQALRVHLQKNEIQIVCWVTYRCMTNLYQYTRGPFTLNNYIENRPCISQMAANEKA